MIALKTAKFGVKSCLRSLGREKFDKPIWQFQIPDSYCALDEVRSKGAATAQLAGSMPANQLHFVCQLCMELGADFFRILTAIWNLISPPSLRLVSWKAGKIWSSMNAESWDIKPLWEHYLPWPLLPSPPSNISTWLLLIIKSNTWVESN